MANDIKERVMKILFEDYEDENPEENNIISEGEIEDITPKKEYVASSVNAKDVLYKSNKSPFVNLKDDNPNIFSTDVTAFKNHNHDEKKVENVIYEPQPTISPIFGPVVDENINQYNQPTKEVDESIIRKPEGNHLGTVLSPFFGFSPYEEDLEVKVEINKRPEIEDIIEEIIEEPKSTSDEIKLLFKEEERNFENHTLEDILEGFKDKTMVSDREINLFDDYKEGE